MRRLWGALAGLITVVMLANSGTTRVAQGHDQAGFATGTITIGESARGGSETVENGRLVLADVAIDGVVEMSDPRLSGSLSWIWNIEVADPEDSDIGAAWGTGLLENEDGAWEGTWAGVLDENLAPVEMQWSFVGQGTYDGLSSAFVLTSTDDRVFAFDAVIVEGALPTTLAAAPSPQILDEDLPPVTPVGAGADPLMEALARVPQSAMDGGGVVSYVDYRAVEAARPGVPKAPTFEDWVTLQAADDASFRLWVAATDAINAPSGRSLEAFGEATEDWTSRLGYDFFDIDQELRFGRTPEETRIDRVKVGGDPPEGIVLRGDFDPGAIESAHVARGYVSTTAQDWSLLCGVGGCEAVSGERQDIRQADPFGLDPDRQDPLAVSSTTLLGSASFGTVAAMRDSAEGAAPSLAEDPAVQTVTGAIPDDVWLRQATFVPAVLLLSDIEGMVYDAASDEEMLLGDFRRFAVEPMPTYRLVLFADVATEDEQLTYVALAYDSEDDASAAAAVLMDRTLAPRSLHHGPWPPRKLFGKVGVTTAEVWMQANPAAPGAAALLRLRAPLAGGLDPQGRADTSGLAYQLLLEMLLDQDVLWLATHSPEGLVGG